MDHFHKRSNTYI